MARGRRKFTKEFKLQVLNEVDAGKSIAQASREHNIHSTLICKWRRDYDKNPEKAFPGNGNTASMEARIAELERMVGRLTMENDLLKKVIARVQEAKK
jgi:transposase